ncbi:MAG: prolipoprotein diacylglyceryl transferase [Yoonia sp.]|nr:prolipoprotein diacylglyceryl transferase [Yoonia sp.]
MIAAITFPDISPEIFAIDLFGFHFALRWYAMGYIVGIMLGWQLLKAALKRDAIWQGRAPMPVAKLEDLLTYIVMGVIAGGRLGYVLFYKPAYYMSHPLEIPQIWTGGMSFHGGFIGVILAVYLFSRRHNIALPKLADGIALAATPAILLVRIANFINAELWGRPTDLPWGVIFPTADGGPRHPSQLYEAGMEGMLLGAALILLAFRFGGLKKPWLLTGTFFTGYGLARFIVEFVRQPDAQFVSEGNPLGLAFQMDGYGLTMGQTLTLPMILIGISVVIWAARK